MQKSQAPTSPARSTSKNEADYFLDTPDINRIEFKILDRTIICTGLVCWTRNVDFKFISKQERYLMGLKFVEISPEDQEFITRYVLENLYS